MKTANKSRKRIFWAILVLVALLPFLLIEFYFYRKFQREFGHLGYTKEQLSRGRLQDSPYSVYEQIPNTLNLKSKFRQNNYGFRDEDDTQDKKPGEFRVFILGGSGALGQGAMQQFTWISGQKEYPTEHTIAARLEEKLRAEYPGKPIEVINAAVSGYKLDQEYCEYMSLVRKLQPDLIILLDGYNDMFFPLDGKSYIADVDRDAWAHHTYKTSPTYIIGMFLMSKSYTLFYWGKQIFASKYSYDEAIYKKWLQATPALDTSATHARFREKFAAVKYEMDDVFKRYEIFKRTCEVDSVNILFCSQPLLALKPHMTDVEVALNNYNLSECEEDSKMMERDGYAYYLHRFDSLARAENLPYLNMQEAINQSDQQVFIDYCHLSYLGNEMIADLLKNKIVEMQLISGKQVASSAAPAR